MLFVDRADAGRQLAQRLRHLRCTDAVVLALPRGGVPVAFEVARELQAPLDVIVVRKLGVPFQPEYGFGAIGEDGARIIDDRVVRQARLTRQEIASVEARERDRLNRRLGQLRGDRAPVPLAGRTAVVVDDGIATGSTARAACLAARARGASRVIVAVPVGSVQAVASLRRDADEVICVHTPVPFTAIGDWYGDFSQVADAEFTGLLGQAPTYAGTRNAAPDPAEVRWSRASGPGRWSSRPARAGGVRPRQRQQQAQPAYQFVAAANRALGTLLVDLLTPRGTQPGQRVQRRAARDPPAITRWLSGQPGTGGLPVGYFGASTGAAATLAAVTATPRPRVAAIVSRGGRPDLVGGRLAQVQTPTLLIVGGADKVVLDLNQRARAQLKCESRLAVIPGATHLFCEPGALGQVTDLAGDWFGGHFAQVSHIAAAA